MTYMFIVEKIWMGGQTRQIFKYHDELWANNKFDKLQKETNYYEGCNSWIKLGKIAVCDVIWNPTDRVSLTNIERRIWIRLQNYFS